MAYLSEFVQAGLDNARRKAERKKSRLSVHVGDDVFPIRQFSETGFVVDIKRAPQLRGLVDIYDGPKHLSRALIIAAEEDGDDMRYEFKRETVMTDTPIRDFAADVPELSGYLDAPR